MVEVTGTANHLHRGLRLLAFDQCTVKEAFFARAVLRHLTVNPCSQRQITEEHSLASLIAASLENYPKFSKEKVFKMS